jgi:hypothetical protein
MARHNANICGTNALRLLSGGRRVATHYPGRVTYRDMLTRNYIINSSSIYCVRALGKIYQKNVGHEDYEMWLRLLARTNAIVLPEQLVVYRVGRRSLSCNKLKGVLWHLNVQLSAGVPPSRVARCFLRNLWSRLNA